jgi:hypothetical protein
MTVENMPWFQLATNIKKMLGTSLAYPNLLGTKG